MQASVFSYVSEFHTKETAPRAAAIVSTFMPVIFLYSATVGIILMPMTWSLDLYFVTFTPWRLFMVIISLANLVNSIAFSFLPESPKFLLAMNRGDETLMVLKSMYRMNTKNAEDVSSSFFPITKSKSGFSTTELISNLIDSLIP